MLPSCARCGAKVRALSERCGALVYVMGPSGAGKDSVLDCARALLPPGSPVIFAHRYITRPAAAGGENHVALTPAEFALRRAHGLFAFHWQAHGNDYGIGSEIEGWRRQGLAVVVSGSREHFQGAGGIDAETRPVLITAPSEHLAARLAARGREDNQATAARLQRGEAYRIDHDRLVTIVNDAVLEQAARQLLSLLATLGRAPTREPAFRRRA